MEADSFGRKLRTINRTSMHQSWELINRLNGEKRVSYRVLERGHVRRSGHGHGLTLRRARGQPFLARNRHGRFFDLLPQFRLNMVELENQILPT